jgi:hypothetical protein
MMVCELFGDRLCANWESREDARSRGAADTGAFSGTLRQDRYTCTQTHPVSIRIFTRYPDDLSLPSLALFLLGYCCSRA